MLDMTRALVGPVRAVLLKHEVTILVASLLQHVSTMISSSFVDFLFSIFYLSDGSWQFEVGRAFFGGF